MDFVLCFRLGGEKRQTDAKRYERSKLDHLIATESGLAPLDFCLRRNGRKANPAAITNIVRLCKRASSKLVLAQRGPLDYHMATV
jgi:hypothetical protein